MNWPFAIFIGFNNHRETIVFGTALMHDERLQVVKTFLDAMSNKHPKTISNDQDAAMVMAISSMMPNTYHGLAYDAKCIEYM